MDHHAQPTYRLRIWVRLVWKLVTLAANQDDWVGLQGLV